MATHSFLIVTLFATLLGIGLADLVQPSTHHDLRDPRATLIGFCVSNGIACGAPSRTSAF